MNPADIHSMRVSGITSSSFGVVAAGVRAQMKSHVMGQALSQAGPLDQNLANGLAAISTEGQAVTEAGLTKARLDLTGQLINLLA